MTETQWLADPDRASVPMPMLRFLIGKASDRKLRLFGCACSRRHWNLLSPDSLKRAVEVAELFADGLASKKALGAVKKEAGIALAAASVPPPVYAARGTAWSTTRNAETAATYPLWVFTSEADQAFQVTILRDLFGNPFRAVPFDPRWRTADALGLARAAYEDRAFDRLPLLADALMDAGCDADAVLDHCRGPGPHVRGCWVVDLVLGKE
jgi:hypothetical protein